jgi:hypothetical protein
MTRRDLLASAGLLSAAGASRAFSIFGPKTKFLMLFSADGLRWQEFFTGIDAQLMDDKDCGMGNENAAALRTKLWHPSAEERRRALLPFFWGTLAPQGIVLGNASKGSSVRVSNHFRNSSPGYSELLTGRAQDDVIRGNAPVQNPTPSVFQFLRNRWLLPPEQAAVFASWANLHYVAETRPGEIFVNAGYEDSSIPASERVADLNRLQHQALYTEDSARHDAFTFALAMEYLDAIEPRLFYISFDETDDWAHQKRYDRVLETIQLFDQCIGELWAWVQSHPHYQNATTLILTCDHGRGATTADWDSHGASIAGADQIWVAFIGPDTPARGEISNSPDYFQRDIAPTALELLGIDYKEYPGVLGKPIQAALPRLRLYPPVSRNI